MDGKQSLKVNLQVERSRGSKSHFFILHDHHSQKDYVCFDFVPRHHNIIRFRKSTALITEQFSTVCSWVQFKNADQWKYDLLLGNNKASNNYIRKILTKQLLHWHAACFLFIIDFMY